MIVDLRSDTSTLPTAEMRGMIQDARVGNQMYDEDFMTKKLEQYCAKLFGKEAALFMPTGTMSNYIAIKTFVSPGEEIIVHEDAHINYAQASVVSELVHACLSTIETDNGFLTRTAIERQIDTRMRGHQFSKVGLITIENTMSGNGGKIYSLDSIDNIFKFAQSNDIPLHIDGARIFNACVASCHKPADYGMRCDTITCSFSQGLGAPFGSMLMGSRAHIKKAERLRNLYGGTMHQTGFMAVAAQYAIKHHMARLADDHVNAMKLYEGLKYISNIKVEKPETNIVLLNIDALPLEAKDFVEVARAYGLKLYPWKRNIVWAMTHLSVNEEDIETAIGVIMKIAGVYSNF